MRIRHPLTLFTKRQHAISRKLLSSTSLAFHPSPPDSQSKDPREVVIQSAEKASFKPTKFPIVLCHGLFGFDVLGQEPLFQVHYWRGIKEALEHIGCRTFISKVPPSAEVKIRAQRLKEFIERTIPEGAELNLVAHSMGGLDGRYLISNLPSRRFKIRSLTTLATPHRGSSFADYVLEEVVGRSHLPALYTIMEALGLDRGGAVENLTVKFITQEFNPATPDIPDVSYYSYGAAIHPGLFSLFRQPWQIIYDREGDNDGLVSVKSSKWGKHVKTLDGVDHLDLINWVNRLKWKLKWHERNEEKEVKEFNAVELYLEICRMLHDEGL